MPSLLISGMVAFCCNGVFGSRVAAWIVGVGLAAFFLYAFVPMAWRVHSGDVRRAGLRAADHAAGDVEVFEVHDATPVEYRVEHLAIDIGSGGGTEADNGAASKLLLIQRHYLSEYVDVYDPMPPEFQSDEGDGYFNNLPPPWAFPSTHFLIHRFPHSGVLVKIEVKGSYREPVDLDSAGFSLADITVLDGRELDLSDLGPVEVIDGEGPEPLPTLLASIRKRLTAPKR